MNYQTFLDCISKVADLNLSGKSVHIEAAPLHRIQSLHREKYHDQIQTAKQAAVLLNCYPKNESMQLSLIQRTIDGGVHSGQIALPGGKKEEKDKSLWYTALREYKEELGSIPFSNSPLLQLSSIYIPPSDFLVTPFLSVNPIAPKIIPDPKEVALHIELPIEKLISLKIKQKPIPSGALKGRVVPSYTFENHFIWGATAMILTEFKYILQNSISN